MLRRRIFIYFILATIVSIVAAIALASRSMETAIEQSRQRDLLFARSVSRFISGHVAREGARLARLLEEVPAEIEDQEALHDLLAQTKVAILGASGIALLDERRHVIASIADTGGLPPHDVLLPALRRAELSESPIVTDVWHGIDGMPRVAIILGHIRDEMWRAAVVHVRIDSDDFLTVFSYFLVDERSRLQLLDSAGIAIFSTRPEERYRSVVHGTYFSDAVRLGDPRQMSCHSCHEDGGTDTERDEEVMTLAPVPNTDWSVTIRDSAESVIRVRREHLFTDIAMVAVTLGCFIGFFLLLRRHVLRPMRELARAAATLAPGTEVTPQLLETRDEFTVLARSFETMRLSAERRDRPVSSGETGANGNGDDDPASKALIPDPAAGTRLRHVAPGSPCAPPCLEHALQRALDSAFEGFVGIGPIRSIVAFVESEAQPPGLFSSRGVSVRSAEPPGPALIKATNSGSIVTVAELAGAGILLAAPHETHAFFVHQFRLLEASDGWLWIGLSADFVGGELKPTLALLATQVTTLIERNCLYEHLRREHAHKNRMLRHLFEAEAGERKRIAREIHDETAQDLTALLLALETFPRGDDAEGQARSLQRAKERIAHMLDWTDRLVRRLRPAVLDDLGLVEAVRTTTTNLFEPAGIGFELEVTGEELPVPKSIENALFRVIQEAATNVVRHSEAARVRAVLAITPARIRCSFEDDGRGMDLSWLDDVGAKPRWGVLGMRERIVQAGGTIRFSTAKHGGLRIDLEVPFGTAATAGGVAHPNPEEGSDDASHDHPG